MKDKKKDIVISPIFYMGNKKKLVQKGLCNLFPKNINHYYEPFSGSCVVAMNAKAKKYYLNDTELHLCWLYYMFANVSYEQICKHIENRIETFGLPKERTKRNVYDDKGKIEEYKKNYIQYRDYFNSKNISEISIEYILDFYTLTLFSFSQQFRFNSNGKYNMPFGNDCFTEKNKQYIKNGCDFFSNDNVIHISNLSFDAFLLEKNIFSQTNPFIYFDPPYHNTTAVYNENRGSEFTWNDDFENRLRNMCEFLTNQKINFAMSNVFSNKGVENTSLKEWCKKNNYRIHHFNHSYTACGKGNANTDEVLIMNY